MLPFWGRMDHMHEAVASIVAQEDRRWRLVIIDDAYPDDSLGSWIEGLADSRIQYLRNASNVGISANFQRAVDLTEAEHLSIMGCDDIMLPGYVGWAHASIEAHPSASFYHPGSETIDSDGHVTRTLTDSAKSFYRPSVARPTVFQGERLATNLVRGNWMNFPAIVWKTKAVRPFGFDPRFSIVQDLDLALRVVESGGSLLVDPSVQFRYRRHAESVSSWRATDGSRFVEERAYFDEVAKRFTKQGWTTAARAARIHLSSRINALAQLPMALGGRDRTGAKALLTHTLGRR